MPVWKEDEVERWSPPEEGGGEPGEGQGEGEPGEGEPGEGEPGEGEPKPGEGQGKPGEGEPKPGEGEGKEGGGKPGKTPDEIHKEIEAKMANRGDSGGKDDEGAKPGEGEGQGAKKSKGGTPGKEGLTGLGSKKDMLDNITPTMNWKTLIKKMVQSSTPAVDLSYAKPSRRSVTGAAIGAALGAAAVKPGEKTTEEPVIKLAFVFDTSGSMQGAVQKALKEAETLLKQLGKSSAAFGVTYFAGDHVSFALDVGQNFYAPLNNIKDLVKPIPKDKKRKPWRQVLTLAATGGTIFGASLAGELAATASMGFNVLIFSDSDILYGDNWKYFSSLYRAHKRNVVFIADGENTWREACEKLGQFPATFTHMGT